MLGNGWRWLLAVGAAAVALALVRFLHPVLDAASYMVLLAAVMVTAVAGGLRPALLTTALAILAIDWFFLAPRGSLALVARTDALLLVLFAGVALLASGLTDLLHRRRERAERDARAAAGLADHFQRSALELGRDVDALHALRRARPEGP